MTAHYDPEDRGQYDAGFDDELARWNALTPGERDRQAKAARHERMAAGWGPDGRNTGRRAIRGSDALASLEATNPAGPTPVMRRIQAETETRAWLDSLRIGDDVDDDPQRCLDWLGNHPPMHTGP